MKRSDALFVALCVGAIAFAVAFVYPQLSGQAIAWYYPVERRWSYEARPSGLAIDVFGRLMQGLVAWSVAVIATLAITRRLRELSSRMAHLLAAWAIAMTLLVMLYFAYTLAVRVPTPLAIPAWYVPR
ncbi:MAG: hypothetical protein AB7P03_20355 [Kofleriaceae bacterium]